MAKLKDDIRDARQGNDYGKLKELLKSFLQLKKDMQVKGLV